MCYTVKHDRLGEILLFREAVENSNDWEEIKEIDSKYLGVIYGKSKNPFFNPIPTNRPFNIIKSKENNKRQENMKKYQLIKAYPNSPKEGTIVKQDDLGQYVAEKPLLIFDKVEIEGYPSFWEEICVQCSESKPTCAIIKKCGKFKEESNYLITAFRSKDREQSLFKITQSGTFTKQRYSEYSLEEMLNGDNGSVKDGEWEIYSVKNSKGEEFTIGDKVITCKDKFTISKFEVCVNNILVRFNETDEHDGLELISKIKQPICTTTDGVDVFEGDNIRLFLLMNKESTTSVSVINFSKQDASVSDRYLTFTSEENRDKYIKENTRKPIFVSADGVDMYEGDEYNLFSVYVDGDWYEKRVRIQQAINLTGWKHFHTKEARQEYIDNNKPKYSLSDIEKAYERCMVPGNNNGFMFEIKKLGK